MIVSTIEALLAALNEAIALFGNVPYVSVVAGLLRQAITMRDASVSSVSN